MAEMMRARALDRRWSSPSASSPHYESCCFECPKHQTDAWSMASSLKRTSSKAHQAARLVQSLTKRWFGVSGLWTDHPDVKQPWPVMVDKMHLTTQPVRYCYGDRNDYNTLHKIVEQAIKMWEPAGPPNSLMEIVPMNGQDDNSICLGDPNIKPDVLNIFDTTNTEKKTVTTLGWDPTILEDMKNGKAQKKWHKLKFERTAGSRPNANGEVVVVADIDRVRMAHELGHALGLDHEHQRQDADQYIKFNCQNLDDYKRVKALIDAKDTNNGYRQGDTIEKACTDASVASRYGFAATQHINERDGFIGQYQRSYKFDYNSIMMYGSYDGCVFCPADKFPTSAVIEGIDSTQDKGKGKGNAKPNFRVYMGGKEPRYVTQVSEGDIARIAQLYPARNAKGELMGTFSGDWKGVPMRVGGPS